MMNHQLRSVSGNVDNVAHGYYVSWIYTIDDMRENDLTRLPRHLRQRGNVATDLEVHILLICFSVKLKWLLS